MAIPFTVQIRTLLFNSTTFTNCGLKNNVDLYPPPPHSEHWDSEANNWNWTTFFNYGSMIKDCLVDYPGITFFGENSEELRFLSMYVQSVGIPFIIENDNKVKKFATENEIDFADRFEILKEAFANKIVNPWITEESLNEWKQKDYPKTFEDYKKFIKKSNEEVLKLYSDKPSIMGMAIANPEKMVKYFYVPGKSSYYGGEGFVITNKKDNKYNDEAFDLITYFIDNTLPFLHNANSYITPFEDTENLNCKQTTENLAECNNYIDTAKSDVYYFINKSNEYVIIKAKHVSTTVTGGNAKLIIDDTDFLKEYYPSEGNVKQIEFTCGSQQNYQKKIITYYNNRIDLPIFSNNAMTTLTIKSTNDYFNSNSNKDVSLCSVANEMLKIARPIQYPLNGFNKMDEIEKYELVAILFNNFYNVHKDKKDATLKDNLEEFKTLVDYYILPNCDEFRTNVSYGSCQASSLTKQVIYSDCIPNENTHTTVLCSYIPYNNIISILSFIVIGFSFITGLVCLFLMIKYRKSKNLSAFGMDFSIILLFATFILTVSIFFWLGEISQEKCLLRIWFQTLGLTNIVGSILLKEERISSIFIGRDVQKIFTPKMKDIYIKLGILNLIQIGLLLFWSFYKRDIKYMSEKEYNNNIDIPIEYCDIFSSRLVAVMFLFIFCMIIYTLLISIKIRNIPKEFNEVIHLLFIDYIYMYI
ncbi:hypothetical protein BCR32DRAFT_242103 [Anaeromyces robustus]|uniref:G-protein coupled receptors family 3 profile domain-containing protein n=1 Tax=Anaeromyces robustus TaxID=1754192 RepID=A0A1Y1XGZ6_9FUNG|nr:hypothetical protein BCR32DRAFT_242103 [Anaeromyces robustus]|eukprot:ORX84993.1 hypothetical protein BCR32DRAFT_242103 [Anaeromyces robustus]